MSPAHTVEGASPPALGAAIRVTVAGRPIAVFNIGGAFFAIDAACTHMHGPLERGRVDANGVVTCPWHGSQFDIRTGSVRRGPAIESVKTYPVRVENQKLVIELP